jgi:hypothetical protein
VGDFNTLYAESSAEFDTLNTTDVTATAAGAGQRVRSSQLGTLGQPTVNPTCF